MPIRILFARQPGPTCATHETWEVTRELVVSPPEGQKGHGPSRTLNSCRAESKVRESTYLNLVYGWFPPQTSFPKRHAYVPLPDRIYCMLQQKIAVRRHERTATCGSRRPIPPHLKNRLRDRRGYSLPSYTALTASNTLPSRSSLSIAMIAPSSLTKMGRGKLVISNNSRTVLSSSLETRA